MFLGHASHYGYIGAEQLLHEQCAERPAPLPVGLYLAAYAAALGATYLLPNRKRLAIPPCVHEMQ